MGIINFQGEREDQKKKFNEPISVRDHMTTKLVTLKPDQSLIEVINLFMENKNYWCTSCGCSWTVSWYYIRQ